MTRPKVKKVGVEVWPYIAQITVKYERHILIEICSL